MKKFYLTLFVLFIVSGCTVSPSINDDERLNIYSARHYDVDKAIIEAFEKESGIDVNIIEGKGDELLERMIREKNNPQADVFITVGAETLSTSLQEDLFQDIQLENIKDVLDTQFYGEKWVAITKRARILVYDKDNPKPMINTYHDLVRDDFNDKILVRSATSSYNIALLASIIQQEGSEKAEEWAKGVVDNFARIPTGNDRDQARAIAAGLGDIAIMNTYYLILMENSSDPADQEVASSLGVILPEDTHMNISYAAILNNANNVENAQKFIDYLLDVEQQTIYMNENGEFPIRNDLTLNPTIQSWGDFNVAPINYETLGDVYAQAVMIFDQVKWE